MTDVDEYGRPEPPLAADETATLVGFLAWAALFSGEPRTASRLVNRMLILIPRA